MRVSFANISKDGFSSTLEKDDVKFSTITKKISDKKVESTGKIEGFMPHLCDRCGEEFILHVDENIEVLVSDGFAEPLDDKLENLIEFFDGFIDFDEIFISELEAIKSDYFYCEKCINLKGE